MSTEARPKEAEVHHYSAMTYVGVWVLLMILTGATWGFSFLDLGKGSVAIAILIALAKASLVLLVFMHYLGESGSARLTLVVAVIFVAVVYTFIITDFANRFPLSVIREENAVPTEWNPTLLRLHDAPRPPLPTSPLPSEPGDK